LHKYKKKTFSRIYSISGAMRRERISLSRSAGGVER